MVKLIIEDDAGKTTVVPLSRDEVTVGRKEGNTIRLTERNVSRRHARILRHNGTVFVEDLGSYNGVKVNGNRIAGRVAVAEGDRIQIGDYLLGIKVDRAAEAPADPFADQKTTPMPLPPPTPGEVPATAAFAETVPEGAAAAPAPEEKPVGPARLVVISQNFFGLVFPLDKAAVVIGRTDENDVVINHRSVSRHHAKIVREKTRYTIVDLQSANGVRVNGEEYGKVELRRGDLVDLGHVRMRFVDPDEEYVPDRDATTLVPMPSEKRGKGLIVGVLLAVAVVGGVLFAMRGKLFGPKEGPVAAAPADAAPAVAVAPMASGPPAPTAAAPTAAAPTGAPVVEAAARLADADKLMKDERWSEAIKLLSEVLQKDPNLELARDKRAKATAEQKNQDALTNLSESVDKKDTDRAHDAFRKIPDDSVYKKRADDLWTRVKPTYVQKHLAAAKRFKDDGRCDAMKRELQALEAQDVGPEVAKLRKDCKEREGAVVMAPGKPPKEPKKGPDVAPAAAVMDDVKAKELVDQAAVAFARGQNAVAIQLASQATKLTKKPGLLNRSFATMALGHCSSGRKDAAQKLANRLDGAWKGQVKSGCRSKGIDLD